MTTSTNPAAIGPDSFSFLEPDSGEWREAWARLARLVAAPAPEREAGGLRYKPRAAPSSPCTYDHGAFRCGEDWEYLGTCPTPHRDWRIRPEAGAALVHQFRHRCGYGHGVRCYVNVPASPGWTPATTTPSARKGS